MANVITGTVGLGNGNKARTDWIEVPEGMQYVTVSYTGSLFLDVIFNGGDLFPYRNKVINRSRIFNLKNVRQLMIFMIVTTAQYTITFHRELPKGVMEQDVVTLF